MSVGEWGGEGGGRYDGGEGETRPSVDMYYMPHGKRQVSPFELRELSAELSDNNLLWKKQ